MAQFNTFDLGQVIANAEAIKGMRKRSITEDLQQQYLGQRMDREQQLFDTQQQQLELKKGYAEISNILNSQDPVAAARSNPMLVGAFRQAGGDVSQLQDDALIQSLRNRQVELASELGEVLPGQLRTQEVGGFNVLQQGDKVLASAAPKQPDALTQRWQQEVSRGYTGSLLDYQKELKAAGRPQVSVNTKQESEESKAIGKALGQQYAAIQKAGVDANSKVSRYERMSQLLDGVKTGKLTPKLTEVAALADALGVKLDPNIGEKQALQALSNEIALGLRNPSGGAGMPGALSDKDREFLVSMTPGLGNTPEGNKLIIQSALKLAKRDQDVAKMARTYRATHGTLEGFSEELAQWSAENPLFESESAVAGAASGADFIYVPGQGLQPGR